MVASNILGCSNNSTILLSDRLLPFLRSKSSLLDMEKKATSEPDITADNSSNIKIIIPYDR
jgi:hypothetical protein